MGGTSNPAANVMANLVLMCGTGTTGCHGMAEENPEWAAENGYRVPSWEDPALVPVAHWRYGRAVVTLTGWEPV